MAIQTKGLFAGLNARAGKESEVADFLRGARSIVEQEPETLNWYALQFDARTFAIFDTFPGHAGRLKHLTGGVGRALIVKTFTLLAGLPEIRLPDLIAVKAPAATATPRLALDVRFRAKAGREEEVAGLLRDAAAGIEGEQGTIAWYATRHGSASFRLVDVFADESAREAHLSGPVAARLIERGGVLFEAAPDIRKADVLASKLHA
jgi:quinol monooxygenase YgiN